MGKLRYAGVLSSLGSLERRVQTYKNEYEALLKDAARQGGLPDREKEAELSGLRVATDEIETIEQVVTVFSRDCHERRPSPGNVAPNK